jgi:hypothetical protein
MQKCLILFKALKVSPKLLLLLLTLQLFHLLQGQEDRSLSFYVSGYGKGMGIGINSTRPAGEKSSLLYTAEFGNLRHPKEIDIINSLIPNSSAYVFGKVNRAYLLRLLAGKQFSLSERRDRKSVGLKANVQGGLTMAYLAPVYVDLLYIDNAAAYYRPTRYNPLLHQQARIGGRSGFTYGLGEGTPRPGLHIRAGLEARWGNYQNDFKSIGCGVMFDIFPKALPIFYAGDNQALFSSFYLTFALGSNR